MTDVVTDALLLLGTGSNSDPLTLVETVILVVSGVIKLAVIPGNDAPLASEAPCEQVLAVPVPEHVQPSPTTLMEVAPVGNEMVVETPVAAEGPLLDTVTV